MHIANPIYDTVFKFLMEDTSSAILLLSTILNESIVSLAVLPQENTQHIKQRSLTVYRLDFSAKIKTEQGFKQVLIEIQKAKLPSDIMRFRRYLGEQYSKKSNRYKVEDNQNPKREYYKPLPIVTIYFLGYALEHIKSPIIKVNRHYYDLVNNREISAREEFIESLTHDSYIIQISQLGATHQTEIEQLLAIFEQQQHLESDEHILDINEQNYPHKYHSLIRRLQQAIAEPEIRRNMDTEDELLADLQDMERIIEEKGKLVNKQSKALKALEKKNQALEEKGKLVDKQNKALEEKGKLVDKQNKALEEKDMLVDEQSKALEEKDKIIAQLKQHQDNKQ